MSPASRSTSVEDLSALSSDGLSTCPFLDDYHGTGFPLCSVTQDPRRLSNQRAKALVKFL